MSTYLSINYSLWPDFEYIESGPPAEVLRRVGETYRQKLDRATAIINRLQADGWAVEANGSYATARHAAVGTTAEAEQRLAAIGVGREDVSVVTLSESKASGSHPYAVLPFVPWEYDDEEEAEESMTEAKIRQLSAAQRRTIAVARRLKADGWNVWDTKHGLEVERPDLRSVKDVRARLAALGIASDWMWI